MMSFDDCLAVSGLQHFIYCRRQWALIHLENVWADNRFSVEGECLHDRAHNEDLTERRKGKIVVRGLRISSASLGVSGQCDVVEFHKTDDKCGAKLHGHCGLWKIIPVEYKRGKSKIDDSDRVQLCCQVMCLEEMFACEIEFGYIFYNETRSREQVFCDSVLRQEVKESLAEMHKYKDRGYTPKAKKSKKCNNCSLKDLCLPQISKSVTVKEYLDNMLK